ncbi:signal recognition particle-docking protein FtsY [Actinomadura luteofluorescens]|uniref:signal recognition particle-docking protein FtsY n=1 Tax=Actinomadura luteofluorescens TaxID=46163 RepID=UPI00216479B1|nr:signal recognition particle-docking protein FtsY [Actinomadura glauciflava]MCR3737550.1 fused signal recognition particle receptor [Actinomadura glauciflava]
MEFVIVIAVLAVIALIIGGVTLLRPRRPRPPVERPSERTGGATAADAADTAAPTIEKAPPTEAPPRPAVEIERPPPGAGRLVRLRARLARSQNAFGKTLLVLLSRDTLDEDAWEEIEDTLISADMGTAVARQVTDDLRTRVQVLGTRSPEEVRAMLKEELLKQIGPDIDRSLHTEAHGDRPAVLMVVGVNGTGKTTTCGKLGRVLVGDGNTVLLGAADTFRAAAADQLETWGTRVGAQVVRKDEGADPASVAFDAVKQGIDTKVNVVIVDTAGRLHTKTGLMDELGKVKRVVEKQATVDEVLLVLDATTGQNGMQQARVFAEVVNITGVVLTKLDGTAKGGIVVQVQRELGVPVKLVGLGEGPDDLAPFEPEAFVDAILGD